MSVEFHGLGKRSALSNGEDISNLDISEAWRQMNRHVLVSLLESVVLLDIMEIITSHHHGSAHLHLGDHSGQNTSTDGNLASKGALFVLILWMLLNLLHHGMSR